MKLLGLYNSKLQAFYYAELLQLYKEAIAQGDFAGNKTFDISAINSLIKQSQDFASLPLASAGQRVTDDSLNNPLDLLITRFNAIVSEAGDFDSRAAGLINVLEKDTLLLDQVLASADLRAWVSTRPVVRSSTKFSWDYGIGHGATSTQVVQDDPLNGVIYGTECPTNTYLDIADGSKATGLVAPSADMTIPAKNLTWTWNKMTPGEQSEDLYGEGWTELSLLEDRPLINFLPNPVVTTILPIGGAITNAFSVAGTVAGGSLPIYIRTLFVPRRNQISITPQNAIIGGTFESSLSGWIVGDGWSQVISSDAHTGAAYESKSPFTAWDAGVTYSIGNTVSYLGNEYSSLTNANTNNLPNAVGSIHWGSTGVLYSNLFPLRPLDQIYIETWIKSLSGNGTFNIALSCRSSDDVELSSPVAFPGVTSAHEYVKISGLIQAIDDPSVTYGRLAFSIHGHTTGSWALDDVRVHTAQNLSPYVINQDEVAVYIPKENSDQPLSVYFVDEEFIIDDIGNITFMGLDDGTQYTVRFTENYPAYQCSINEATWSPIVMLDPDRPYPDTEEVFNVIPITSNSSGSRVLFPITDELGLATGLTLQMIQRPLFEYYFQVTTPAHPQCGATAVLEIDLSKPSYLNGLAVSPFSTYPIRLVKVETESFTVDTRQTIGTPNVLLDRPMVLTFPTTLLRKVYLTCYQENYNLSEHMVEPPDSLRRDTLYSIQTVLPFNVRSAQRAVPIYYHGAQYVFGLEYIAGISATPILPGIFIAGPHRFNGCPDVFRFDVEYIDEASIPNLDVYLCWKAYNSSGDAINSDMAGQSITPGTCQVFPFISLSLLDSAIDHVDIFLKFILRNEEVVVQRYLLQVSSI